MLCALLLTAPATALTINCPSTLTAGQILTLSGTSEASSVILSITGPGIHTEGAALDTLHLYDLHTGTTIISVVDGSWTFSWIPGYYIDAPITYTIHARDRITELTADFHNTEE